MSTLWVTEGCVGCCCGVLCPSFDHAKGWMKSTTFDARQWHSIDRVRLLGQLPEVDPTRLRGPQVNHSLTALALPKTRS